MYMVGDKVEVDMGIGGIRQAYLISLRPGPYPYRQPGQSGPLWELRFTRAGHEFYKYESNIIRRISSNFEGI